MQDVLLVGSIPLDTPEEVFREFGKPLGAALKTMPDGEVGPRKHWISRIHYQVLSGHPELETVQRPAPNGRPAISGGKTLAPLRSHARASSPVNDWEDWENGRS